MIIICFVWSVFTNPCLPQSLKFFTSLRIFSLRGSSYTWSEIIFISCRASVCAHILRIHVGTGENVCAFLAPHEAETSSVPPDVSHWLFPAEQYLGLTKLGTDGILRSREDSRWPTVSPPSSDILRSSPIVGEFVTSGYLSNQLWTNRCKSVNTS